MRISFILFILHFFIIDSWAQEVLILNQQNNLPVEHVVVFNKALTTVTYSNALGKADLSKFSEEDSVFFKHPSIKLIGLSFQDITEMKFVLKIDKQNIMMDDIVVTASRWKEKKRDIPFMTDVIKINDSKISTLQTTSDILSSTGNLMVQKSQGGAGSPIIRGFEANRLLLVIDGVRMNNAIYRSGHLQNSMSLDLGGLDKIEVIYGPTSVIYGSDALGGVIHYYTKNPVLSNDEKAKFNIEAVTQFSSANRANITHVGINAGFKSIAFLSGVTRSDFGDIRIGRHRKNYPVDHGKINSLIKSVNGRDTLTKPINSGIQPGTGYLQYDMTHKVLVSISKDMKIIANVQYSISSNINRFDELYNFNELDPTYAEWYYGPQKRFFSSLKLVSEAKTKLYSELNVIVAFQDIDEDRINRKFNRSNRLYQEEDVKVYSLNIDFQKAFSDKERLEYGFEANYNDVNSKGYNVNIHDNSISEALSRYPDKGSYVSAFSGYGGYKWTVTEKLKFYAGARYSHTFIKSKFSEKYDMIPFSDVDIATGALTGSASMVYNPQQDLKISFILSTGFRAPNVDDYGKVRAKDEEVTLPNNKLGPEYAYNAELGIMKTFDSFLSLGGNAYYTLLTDAIVNSFSSFNGKDSLFYNGDMYRIVTNTNSNKAYITGFSLFFNVDFTRDLHFNNTFNYTKGKDISNNFPLGHIPPLFGRSELSFEKGGFRSEMFVNYHGWKNSKDYSPTGEDNLDYATPKGNPDWATLNINTAAVVAKNIQLQFSVENILDTYYRVFASGVSAPGRNFIITLKASI